MLFRVDTLTISEWSSLLMLMNERRTTEEVSEEKEINPLGRR